MHTTNEADLRQSDGRSPLSPLQKTTFPQMELQEDILDRTQDDYMGRNRSGRRQVMPPHRMGATQRRCGDTEREERRSVGMIGRKGKTHQWNNQYWA